MSDNEWVDEGWNRLFFSLGVRTSLAETLDWEQDLAEYLFDIWADQMPQFAFKILQKSLWLVTCQKSMNT